MLFWTELKQEGSFQTRFFGFRAVLFWTELKQIRTHRENKYSFRAVLFWTELNRNLTIMSYIMFYKV